MNILPALPAFSLLLPFPRPDGRGY